MIPIYKLVLRSLLTRGRLAAIGSAGVVMLLLGGAAGARARFDRESVAYLIVSNFGVALLVPVTALVFASAALGDPTEDGTLVYLWLRPIPRWRIVAAAAGAVLTVALPLAVVPVAGGSLLARASGALVAGATVAAALAVVAYGCLFVGLGLILRRALAWGLAYVLIWEGVVAGIGTGPARLSVRLYARSILDVIAGQEPARLAVSGAAGVIVPLVIGVAALFITSMRLASQDVA